VAGICVERDAISAAVASRINTLREIDFVSHVDLVTQFCDRPIDAPVHIVTDPWQLLRLSVIDEADVVIFHWGIYYTLFDALPIVALERRAIVQFHNMTPVELVPESERGTMALSRQQIELLLLADVEVWTESEFNRGTLLSWGLPERRVSIVTFVIEAPRPLAKPSERSGPVRFLTVGRMSTAKGTDVLVDAFDIANHGLQTPVELRILGNPAFDSPHFSQDLRDRLNSSGVCDIVTIITDAADDELWASYEWADVLVTPSLHEGLCVPIIEAYSAGCRVIGTSAGNVPYVVQSPDPLVTAGNVQELADAIAEMATAITNGATSPPPGATELVERFGTKAVRASVTSALADFRQ
jgi:glycosyltransferase involved in cell wall biosynthesis